MTVQERLAAHHAAVQEHYGEQNVFATMLYGSQNYNLSTPQSDVDTKAMVLPTFRATVLNSKLTSTELTVCEGLCNVKDVRAMFDNFRKSNINFLEVLFTHHKLVNPRFKPFWDELYNSRHEVANAHPLRLMHATAGMAQQKYVAMEKPFESKTEVLSLYGYDPKQLHHLVRLCLFMQTYRQFGSFAACLVPEPAMHEYLMSLKTSPLPLEEARKLREKTKQKVDTLLAEANNVYDPNPESEKEVKDFLDDLAYRTIYSHFATEFGR